MRAKKFGVTNLSDDAKKLARAERFGKGTGGNTNSASSIKLNVSTTKLDLLITQRFFPVKTDLPLIILAKLMTSNVHYFQGIDEKYYICHGHMLLSKVTNCDKLCIMCNKFSYIFKIEILY